jgi:hypothetical protein
VVAVVAVIAYVGRGRQVGSSGTTQQQSGMINKAATIACRTWNGQMQMDRRSVAGDARGEGAVVVRGEDKTSEAFQVEPLVPVEEHVVLL